MSIIVKYFIIYCAAAVHFLILLIAYINLIFIVFNSETKPNMLPNYFSFG